MKDEKIYSVEYKNRGGYTCGQKIEADSEDHAVRLVQLELITEDDYMTELLSVDESAIHDEPVWKLDDGTSLDQDSQDALNESFLNILNVANEVKDKRYTWSGGQITDNETGSIYVHEQHAYWNKIPNSVQVIVDGHRYNVK